MPGLSPPDTSAVTLSRSGAGAGRRVLGGLLALLVVGLLLVALHADPQVAASADNPVLLAVYANGRGEVSVTATPTIGGAALDEQTCRGIDHEKADPDPAVACRFFYARGRRVTLVAKGDPAQGITFVGWNDDRCPEGSATTCVLTLTDDEDFVMAIFSPQFVNVNISGPGSVTANGVPCDPPDCTKRSFPLNTVVTFVATRDDVVNDPEFPIWADRCDATGGTKLQPSCSVILNRVRGVAVGFGGNKPPTAIPPKFGDAMLRVKRIGNGSGTVRSQNRNIDCPGTCGLKGIAGDFETLVAYAAGGSRFAGWSGKGVCPGGTSAQSCKVPFGARVGARFDRTAGPPGPGPGPVAFAARLSDAKASGSGSGRKVSFKVIVSVPAVVTARLLRGGRQIAKMSRQVSRGLTPVAFKVPKGARRGKHKLVVKVAAGSASKTFPRTVTLRR